MIFTIITEQERLLPLYITGIGIQRNQEMIRRPVGFNHYQWSYCSAGRGVFRVGKEEVEIGKGQGFYFYPGIAHEYFAIEEPWEIYWITFHGNRIEELLRLMKIGPWGSFINEEEKELLENFRKTYEILAGEELHKIIQTSASLYQILVDLQKYKEYQIQEDTLHPLFRLQPVIQYMEKYHAEDLELEQLAQLLGVTSYHLCRLFKASFSVSPIHYLMRLRIQEAKKKLIMEGDKEVKEIAREVGYRDVSYFGKLFKKQEKMTAKEFRKLHGIGK